MFSSKAKYCLLSAFNFSKLTINSVCMTTWVHLFKKLEAPYYETHELYDNESLSVTIYLIFKMSFGIRVLPKSCANLLHDSLHNFLYFENSNFPVSYDAVLSLRAGTSISYQKMDPPVLGKTWCRMMSERCSPEKYHNIWPLRDLSKVIIAAKKCVAIILRLSCLQQSYSFQ